MAQLYRRDGDIMSNPFGMSEICEISKIDSNEIPTSKAFENYDNPNIVCRDIHTVNEDLEGKFHPETGVKYVRKEFMVNGEKLQGVFPEFESKFETCLPRDMLFDSDDQQFKYCTESLANQLQINPELKAQFTPRQLEQIKDGNPRISGLTWHHKEFPPGSMQLVNSDIHSKSGHTGGRSIWGGGSECR